MTMTAPLHFADPTSSTTIALAGDDDHRSNHGVFVSNGNSDHLKMNTLGNGNIGDGIVSSTASENEMLLKPAHPADDGKDGSCADGDDTAKNTSSDDDDDFEIVSLEEERPPAVQTDAAPISEEPRATPPRLQEEQNDRSASAHVREKQSVVVVDNDCREELSRFFLREKHASPTTKPQTHSDIVASPSHPHHHPQRSLRPLLLQVPPHTPLLLDVAATFPVIAHIHPSSPLRDHVRLGDVLVYIDGKNSVQWSFEALTRRLNSDAFGADGVERTHKTKRKRETKEMGSVDGNGEEAAEEKKKAATEGGCRTLIVLPKEQFRQRPRRRSRKKTARKEDRENSGLVTPAKDRHPDGIAPCIATPTTTTTTSATNTTSITTAPIAAITAIATTNKVTPDDEDDDDIENPHGQDPTTIAKQTNVVVVAPTSLPSATSDNITADDGKETHFQTKAASATITADTENQEPMSEVESVRNSLELSNPMAVTEVDGNGNSNGLGEEGCRDDDEIDDEDEVEIIDENVRHDVHIPTTASPSATNKPSTPPEQEEEEEEREYETLKRLVLRLQSQASTLTPHQRRIYEESYELLKERDRELRRNRPPVDIDVIAIRRRGDGCVSLRIRDRDDVDDSEDGEEDEEFSVEEVSTIYGGKWNPALFSASPRRLEDVWGYDVEEGYGYGGFHHRHHHHHHDDGNRYLTLDQGDASDNAPSHQNLKHHRHDIPHPNILGLLHPAIHRYRFDADARDALLQQQDEEVRRMALESLKRQQKRVEGFFVSLMFAAVGALIVILVMVFWAKD